MSFKTLQNALFQMSGSRAMPSTQSTVITKNNVSIMDEVFPFDGWARISAVTEEQNEKLNASITNNLCESNSFSNLGGQTLSATIPGRKGVHARATFSSGNVARSMSITFVKLVGGGLRAFLRWLGGFGEVCYVC